MPRQNWEIPAGKLIAFSEGEYSDYGLTGHFVTLEDITEAIAVSAQKDAEKIRQDSRDEYKKWDDGGRVGEYPGTLGIHEAFISALIRKGILMSVEVNERHLGSYGELEI